jgi:hypothetical protein
LETFSAFFGQRDLRRDAFPWLDDIRRMAESLVGKTFRCPGQSTEKNLRWTLLIHAPTTELADRLQPTETFSHIPLEYVIEVRFEVDRPSLSDLKQIITYNGEISDAEYHPLWREFVRFSVESEVSIIAIAMDLCSPGASFRGKYILEIQGRPHLKEVGYSYLEGPFQYAEDEGFAPSDPIEFEKVWSYLSKVNGLREGTPDTPAGKVLSALTYLCADTGPSARFFKTVWACYGLEGFYAEGGNARGTQVSEKAALFLNLECAATSRLLKLLYESRSKFIHGNKALSSALVEVHPPEGKASLDEWDAEFAGAYFLAETARQCIRKNISRQSFSLQMTG